MQLVVFSVSVCAVQPGHVLRKLPVGSGTFVLGADWPGVMLGVGVGCPSSLTIGPSTLTKHIRGSSFLWKIERLRIHRQCNLGAYPMFLITGAAIHDSTLITAFAPKYGQRPSSLREDTEYRYPRSLP